MRLRGRNGWVAVLVASALALTTCATHTHLPALAKAEVSYIYDAAGRLRAVVDRDAKTAVYSYDPAGNVIGIERHSSKELSVIDVTPARGAPGDEVVVQGTGFDGEGDNKVSIGGTEAEVTDASPLALTVTVPDDAETGEIEVDGGGETASSPTDFTVANDNPPVITGFSPEVVAAGDELRIEGKNFTGDPLLDQVVLGGSTYASVQSASESELVVTVSATARSGEVAVATPYGTGKSEASLTVAPSGYTADEVGSAVSAELDEATEVDVEEDKASMVSFEAKRDHRLALELSGDDLACAQLSVGLVDPMGVVLVRPQESAVPSDGEPTLCADDSAGESSQSDEGSAEIRLPVSGEYTLTLAGRSAGVAELTVEDLGEDDRDEDRNTAASPTTSTTLPDVIPEELLPTQGISAPPGGLVDGVPDFPVDLASGVMQFSETDMVLADDVLPVRLSRGYLPVAPGSGDADGEFGSGSGLEFNMTLDPSSALQYAELNLSSGLTIVFDRVSEGLDRDDAVLVHSTTPTGFFGATLIWSGSGWEIETVDGHILEFASDGPLRAIRDRNGVTTSIYREAVEGPVSSVVSSTGRWISFEYEGDRISRASNNVGETVSYSYTSEGILKRATYQGVGGVAGAEIVYGYDDSGRIKSMARGGGDPDLVIGYDDSGRVAAQRLADGSQYSFSYATSTRPGPVEDIDEEIVVSADVTDPVGSVRRVTFADGAWVTDTYGVGTPAKQTIKAERDPDTGFVTTQTDAAGLASTYGYDDDGNLTSAQVSGEDSKLATEFGYSDRFSDLSSMSDQAGRGGEMTHDPTGNLVTQTDAFGGETSYEHDSRGRVTSITDQDGNTTEVAYELGHRATVTDPAGNSHSEYYDVAGRLAARTDGTGATTTYAYDSAGRVAAASDPSGAATEFGYDDAGNLASLTDANGNTTRWRYDGLGRVVEQTDPRGATERFGYDELGNVTAHVDRRGVRNEFAYDAVGRLVSASYGVDGTAPRDTAESTVSMSYNAAGRLTEVDDSSYGKIGFGYDDLGRLVSETGPLGEVAYAHNEAGQRASMTLGDGTETTYSFSDAGLLTETRQGDAEVSMSYDDFGRAESIELPNDVTAEYGYDERGFLGQLEYDSPDGDRSYGYRYDANGRRSAATGDDTRVDIPDAVGSATIGSGNRLTQTGSSSLEYDAVGNLISDGTSSYTWNARGQLVEVKNDERTLTFTYDPFGRRASKTAGQKPTESVSTEYVYDGDNIVQTHTGDKTATYLTGLGVDQIFARTIGDEITTYLADPQGSIVGLVDDGGGIATEYTYDPYGAPTVHGKDDPNPFTFTGRELDDTGQLYFRARYYSPQQGRFISEDPAGFAAGDPNLYAYGFGDPVNTIDPSGLAPEAPEQVGTLLGTEACLAAAIVAIAITDYVVDGLLEQDPFEPRRQTEAEQIEFDRLIRIEFWGMEYFLTVCGLAMTIGGFVDIVPGIASFGRTLATRLPGAATRTAPQVTTLGPRALPAGQQTATRLTNGAQFETLSSQPISGVTRSAHRAAANKQLLRQLEADPALRQFYDDALGTDVMAHMQSGRSGLRNPPETQWHHPAWDPDSLLLLRTEVHRHPLLQGTLHLGARGGGGFAEFYGGGP